MDAHTTFWNRRPQPIDIIYRPFQKFAHQAASGGVVLLLFTIVALAWANSPWANSYHGLWHTSLTFRLGPFELSETLHHWINDGLMVIFFFVVGLEIKREVLTGELASPRKAMLPIAAAVGGMLVPALIYAVFNFGDPTITGWGIPMATDIAFALGILALLGERVPLPLKVFLTALAIVDDLGAVLVIALFYTADLNLIALLAGAVFFALMLMANRVGISSPLVYFILGLLLWLAFLKSGVHATIAGVLAALAIPARQLIDEPTFLQRGRFLLNEIASQEEGEDEASHNERIRNVAQNIEAACEYVQPPLHRLEHALHPWVSFFIMPVFALANAGVSLDAKFVGMLAEGVTLGVVLGLVLGKQAGITLFSWLSVRLGWAALPQRVGWRHIYGVAWLGGIGFTMSMFIANLAFQDEVHLTMGKVGILVGSLIAGLAGYLLLRKWIRAT